MFANLVFSVLLAATSALPAVGAAVDEGYRALDEEAYIDDLREAGYTNGDMPATRMIEVGECLLERDAAYTLSLMSEAARADGVELVAQECYRSYGTQAAAYERRCPVEEEDIVELDPETGEEVVVGVKKTRSCSGPPIARAGHSNHGWGRAVDFGNGRRVLSCGDTGFEWLQENGIRFGWVHPAWAQCGKASREPWHWEWGGLTDIVPVTVPVRHATGSDTRIR